MVIDFKYLKPIFINRISTIGIQKVITLRIKGFVYILVKKDYINSNIYTN